MAKNNFVFYKSFFEAIKEFEDKDKIIIIVHNYEVRINKRIAKFNRISKIDVFVYQAAREMQNNKNYESGCVLEEDR